jgi:ferredoxin
MSESVFFKLGERLNQYQVKMLLVEPFLKLLQVIYTEEEAALGAEFPIGSLTARELSDKLGRVQGPLTTLLETMADKGTVFVTKTDEGVSHYALMPFVPGVVELQLTRGTDTPRDRKMARLLDDLMEGEMGDLMGAAFKDPEVAKQLIPIAPARTITVQEQLPPGTKIYPFEQIIELVEKETYFGAAKCYCRHHAYLLDRPCQVKGVPEYSCMMFGKTARYVVERGFGKEITKQEALQILKATEDAGLVHNTNNFIDSTVFVCNCCGCCCGFLKMLKKFDSNAMLSYSNFVVEADTDLCSGCELCLERCQVQALSLADELITIDTKRCLGCGNCVSVCPTGCLSMARRSEKQPPKAGETMMGLGM